ncbi:MAG: L-lactate permease, partial [Bacillota bacterium]
LTLIPVIVCAFLLIKVKMQTIWCALVAWILVMIIALVFFNTPLSVALRASVHGAVTSLPMALMVCTSIFQVAFMESTGAIKRLGVFLKTISPANVEARTMIVNIGAGTTLNSVGANPLSFLPPILKDLGYSKLLCIALPAIGFDALCTYSMMAAPLVVFSDLTGVSLVDAAKYFSLYLPVISTMICIGMFALIGGAKMVKKGLLVAIVTGLAAGWTAFAIAHIPALESAIVLTGVIAGVAAIAAMLLYLKVTKTVVIDRSLLTKEDKKIEASMSLGKAISPWIILIVCLLLVAFVPPLNYFLKVKLEGPLQIIPLVTAKTRPLWNAYFWVVVSTLLSFFILRPTREQLRDFMRKFARRSVKPTLTSVVFFGVGLVMNFSGYQVQPDGSWALFEPLQNMVTCLSQASAQAFGALYPLIVPPLGLFGGFVTTSEASALAMFSPSNLQTAAILGINGPVLAAATGVAGGLASVISPGKLVNAAATIDAMGHEGEVIKKTFKIAVVLMFAVIVLAMIFSKTISPV